MARPRGSETIHELTDEVTIVIVEHGPTDDTFDNPQDPRTTDYVNGRFG
ncbi:hypothetical protein ACGFZQ_07400 [Streptomyces sp. NPDC048254]